jgi:Domain of unknown function (DUF932)
MNGQLSHARSDLVTRADLMMIPPPAPTPTWRPIAHGDLLTAIDRQILVRGITIRGEKFAVQREGARLFAVLDLSIEGSEEFCAAMGVRTANDHSMALEIAVGVKVFVCDNLAFSGDLIALRRKHTAKFDLNADISRAVDRYQAHLMVLRQNIATIREAALTDEAAKATIFEAFRQEILPVRYFKRVAEAYFNPSPEMTDVAPRTLWGLHNAFTRSVRDMAPAPAFRATTHLGQLFGLRTSGQ